MQKSVTFNIKHTGNEVKKGHVSPAAIEIKNVDPKPKKKPVESSSVEEKRKLVLQTWYKKVQMRRIMHMITSRMLHRWHMFLGCSIMVISAITGGAGLTLPNYDEIIISYGMSGTSLIVAALSAIQHFCRFEARSTEHQHVSEDYDNLSRSIQSKMQENISTEILQTLTTEFNTIVDKAPIVPEYIAKKYCDLIVDEGDGTTYELCDV